MKVFFPKIWSLFGSFKRRSEMKKKVGRETHKFVFSQVIQVPPAVENLWRKFVRARL
jgi:hypothetical protein